MHRHNRRTFLKSTGAAVAGLALGPQISHAAANPFTRPPNILFIMVDDLGKEWLHCCGSEEKLTPNIDALAAGGMRLENAYSMPLCTPTRAALLTGQYPFRNGWVNHWDVPRFGGGAHFDPEHNPSFARMLRDAGYRTAIAGKWQINDFRIQPDVLGRHGFDEWCVWTGGEMDNPPSDERYWSPYIHTRGGSQLYTGAFGPDVYTNFLIDFMHRHKDNPMMLYFPMCLTHTPFVHTPTNPAADDRYAKQRAMVRYTDECVGRLVNALDELGLREDTIIFFCTDNGSTHGIEAKRNGRTIQGGKGQMTESGVNMPCIVNGPGRVPAGVALDALIDITDMLPTFAALAGAELPDGYTCDGENLAPVILGEAEDGPRSWIMAMGGGRAVLNDNRRIVPEKDFAGRVLRDKRYKLYVDTDRAPHKLIDLETDPGEEHNIIDTPEERAAAAREKLLAALATFPRKDAAPRYDPLPPQPWEK
ncbi:MAG: sulfatase-like hydrolase/transferase [Candidatus Hydrogenedentota bacterium]